MEMETFSVEKSLYDIDSGSDLRYLWDSDIEQQDVFRAVGDTDMHDWGPGLLDVKPHVILHDRLISDAALGKLPVKTEHSYSLSSSDGDSIPDSPLSVDNSMDDLESECYPCMTMKCRDSYSPITVKEEPLSEPASPQSVTSCYPMSPCSSPPLLHAEIYQNTAPQKWPQQTQQQQSILKQQQQQPTFLVTTRANLFNTPNRIVFPKLNIKVEPISSGFPLPPTPPSSTTSDSESNLSPDHEASPLNRRSPGATTTSSRLFLSTNRQPIQTPLISTQQKGSTGMLILTEEEKRTLLAEGYPIPTRLPLTKTEEKSLKKIRRKIKNKISAQESRRKKKEYMDALEKKVEILVMENDDFKNKIELLEDKNAGLLNQLRTLQALVTRGSLSGRHTDTPAINSTFFNESSTDK